MHPQHSSMVLGCCDMTSVILAFLSIGLTTGIGYWQAGNVFSAMANQDHLAGTTTNQATVVDNLNKAFSLYSNYDQYQYNDDAMYVPPLILIFSKDAHTTSRRWWATAAIYAYRAYKDNGLLSNAVATWNHVTNLLVQPFVLVPMLQLRALLSVVTQDQANAGSNPNKNFTLEGTCNCGTLMTIKTRPLLH